MVEERTDSLKAPEGNDEESSIIMSSITAENSAPPIDGQSANVVHPRASIGSSLVRNSTEKSHSTKSQDDVVPHYMRRSAGSCHDLCKYGRNHASEEEAKARARLLRKRNGRVLPNELIPVQILVADDKKKEKVVNDKPPIQNRRHSLPLEPSSNTRSNSTKHKKSLEKAEVVTKNTYSADAKKLSLDLQSRDAKSFQRAARTSSDVKTSLPRQSATGLAKHKPMPKKLPSPEPPEIIKSVCFPTEKVEVPGKKVSSADIKAQKLEKKTAVPAKHHYSSLKVKVKPSLSSEKPDASGKEKRNNISGTGKNLAALKASTKKVLSPKLSTVKIAPIKLRKDGTPKLVSPLKDKNKLPRAKTRASIDGKVSEKTLHVIKTETENNIPESIPDDHAISILPSLPTEALVDTNSSSLASNEVDVGVIKHINVEAAKFASGSHESPKHVEENHNKTPRKGRVAVSDVRHGSPVKLKFKTGKVVDLKSDNYSPRKLRFRRARVLATEDSKGSMGRTLRKGGANDKTGTTASSSSVKVVLKHQDVQDKKDAQCLFNNVIEETASKLVESRKSKVKALVGAFETVISLQES
ncbi:uncharacterized protein LOC127243498 [Andrographis paniculata]|uniref:uncharacterized protein LOC127243498 n=1 Tax=Andrographis paniculata TaxID=175694 RepID=UPI0021E8E1D6|nr:uncharacterized protein LOC127243498 [Andrographis paniculata]XP_051119520.1 uncharacterized protein LOC127243498 [Andrographis paniculata]XP_051119528.1 uncharacterized protein LOC127243498 [Andrographis paniculata]XP_051119537.1 uncharacterized protein LOC127243498 [Andrographis paniculata]XP_051119546.1 uncharacterized protein LOC127243498 [Andrographis paniculata]XP_051119555.1 uncharacterized protein LOC127243498 [Andrographis paniculata]XP_051119563.1 uncharacterized protein LOC12724